MAFKGLRSAAHAKAADVYAEVKSSAMRRALLEDGLSQLTGAIAALAALEGRLRMVEDDITAGDALALAALPTAEEVGVNEFEPRLMETALLIGATIRRMNLRLGGIERALDGRAPFGVEETIPLRAPAQLAAYDATRDRRAGAA